MTNFNQEDHHVESCRPRFYVVVLFKKNLPFISASWDRLFPTVHIKYKQNFLADFNLYHKGPCIIDEPKHRNILYNI